MTQGNAGLEDFPGLLKRAILDRSWERRKIESRGGEIVTHATFLDFVTYHPYQGLGADVRTLQNLCRDDPEALTMIDKECQRGDGNPTGTNQYTVNGNSIPEVGTIDIIHSSSFREDKCPSGTSRARALRKLRTESEKADASPEVKTIYQRVLKEDISPHRGMIEAGFLKEPTDYDLARRYVRKLTKAEWARLVKEMEAIK